MKRILLALCLLLGVNGAARPLASEPFRVVGTVVSASDGKPMPGACVFVKNGAEEVVTDSGGRYAIEAGACDTLVFRFVTYEEQQLPAAGRRRIDVRMREAEADIDKVVVRTWIRPDER